jgi:undecaprenyl-diphosphatase
VTLLDGLVAHPFALASASGSDITFGQAAVLGVVQGLTEFLPISSTAHLRIVPALLGWPDPGAAFTAVIQLGTVAAVVLYFWRELLQVAAAWTRGVASWVFPDLDPSVRHTLEYRMGWYLILATIPVSVCGLAFSDQIETGARNLWLISVVMIALAGALYFAERIGTRSRNEEQLNGTDAIAVGGAQALALIPGASRSGTTITAGLFRGLDRPTAARFSFLLSVPAVVLSGAYEARKVGDQTGPGLGVTLLATVLAFIVGFASIAWFLRWMSRHSTYLFIWYRVSVGILLIVLLSMGTIDAT